MRKLAITKRVSLADVAEGWQDCYAVVSQLSYLERSEIVDAKPNFKTEVEATHYMIELVKKHVISGLVKAIDDAGELTDMPLTPDDIDGASRELVQLLFNGIMGVSEDPKGSLTETATSSTPTPTTELSEATNSTKTQ